MIAKLLFQLFTLSLRFELHRKFQWWWKPERAKKKASILCFFTLNTIRFQYQLTVFRYRM